MQRHLPNGDGGDGTLVNDTAISNLSAKGLTGYQTALAYAVGIDVTNGLVDQGQPGEGIVRYNGVGGGVEQDFDLRDDDQLKLFIKSKSQRENPLTNSV